MGKICNNAEMFIQSCMTSSVKRTYSEPVKTLTASKTKFRDCIKEYAYIKEKQSKECGSKHGAIVELFKEMFKVFKRSQAVVKKKRQSVDNTNVGKETRVKIVDSTKDLEKESAKKPITKPKKMRDSSSSISISSLLLRPKYQSKYYKKENSFNEYKSKKRNDKEKNTKEGRHRGEDYKAEGERLPLLYNQKKPQNMKGRKLEISNDVQPQKMKPEDTEELIKLCVNTMRQPFNTKFVTLFDQQKMEHFIGLEDIAATMARKIAMDERRERYVAGQPRGLKETDFVERNYCIPSCSREASPLKPKQSKEAVESIDVLVKQLYLKTVNSRNLPPGEQSPYIVPRESRDNGDGIAYAPSYNLDHGVKSEEEARARMLRKYQELQMEVERLNRSLRQFANDFLYQDSRKTPIGTARKEDSTVQRNS